MVEWVTIGDARLACGDCLEVLAEIGPVDCIVTDPPYGIDYESGYATDALWAAGRKITGDSDCAVRDFFLTDWAVSHKAVPPTLMFGSRRRPVPPMCRMVLVWDKGPALGMGALDIPWKPSSEEIYVIGHGFVGARDESNVLYCPPVQSMAKNGRIHPNEKPVALIERLLKKCPAGRVLDPFAGSGSTGVACAKLGRPFVGIEIEPRWFDAMCKRIEAAYAQPDFFVPRAAPEYPQEPML